MAIGMCRHVGRASRVAVTAAAVPPRGHRWGRSIARGGVPPGHHQLPAESGHARSAGRLRTGWQGASGADFQYATHQLAREPVDRRTHRPNRRLSRRLNRRTYPRPRVSNGWPDEIAGCDHPFARHFGNGINGTDYGHRDQSRRGCHDNHSSARARRATRLRARPRRVASDRVAGRLRAAHVAALEVGVCGGDQGGGDPRFGDVVGVRAAAREGQERDRHRCAIHGPNTPHPRRSPSRRTGATGGGCGSGRIRS